MAGYVLGLDIGTTFTAAAVSTSSATIESVVLGASSIAVPSVLHIDANGSSVFGEVAARRSHGDPLGIVRLFKRRLGDTVPIMIGIVPWPPDVLVARAVRHVIDFVSAERGETPSLVVLTHPASWGAVRRELLQSAARQGGAKAVRLLSEPEAAAFHYASQERVPVGTTLAIYDLGGGTFDAVVLRKARDGFEVLGQAHGLDRFGGADLDEAIFSFVDRQLDGLLGTLAPDDPPVASDIADLKARCVEAKETLSSEPATVIPVRLAGHRHDVRITRRELEAIARPLLEETITALRQTVNSAGVDVVQIDRVVLAGGASRMPLVSELVAAALSRPVAVDANPKLAVAAGAAAWGVALGVTGQSISTRPATSSDPPQHHEALPNNPLTPPVGTAPQASAGADPSNETLAPRPTDDIRVRLPERIRRDEMQSRPADPLPSATSASTEPSDPLATEDGDHEADVPTPPETPSDAGDHSHPSFTHHTEHAEPDSPTLETEPVSQQPVNRRLARGLSAAGLAIAILALLAFVISDAGEDGENTTDTSVRREAVETTLPSTSVATSTTGTAEPTTTSQPLVPPPGAVIVSDPSGDSESADLLEASVTRGTDEVIFVLRFEPATFDPSTSAVSVGLDLDGDPTTGTDVCTGCFEGLFGGEMAVQYRPNDGLTMFVNEWQQLPERLLVLDDGYLFAVPSSLLPQPLTSASVFVALVQVANPDRSFSFIHDLLPDAQTAPAPIG